MNNLISTPNGRNIWHEMYKEYKESIMKTKQLHIQPRQSGKTTKIIEMFLNDLKRGRDSIIIVPNGNMKKFIFDQISLSIGIKLASIFNNIRIPNKMCDECCRGRKIDNIYIDEALFCDKSKLWKLYRENFLLQNCNIIAYSTSDRLYSEELITLTKLLKLSPYLEKYIRVDTLEEIEEHYWKNIITEDFEIIAPHSKNVPKDKFRTEYMGEFHETN